MRSGHPEYTGLHPQHSTGVSEATPLYLSRFQSPHPRPRVPSPMSLHPDHWATTPHNLLVHTQTRRTRCGVTAPWIKRALAPSRMPLCPEFPDTEPPRFEVLTVPRSSSCVPQHPATAPWSSHCLTIHPCRAPSPVPCNPNNRPPLLRSPVVSRSGPHAFEPLFSQPSTTTSL